MLSMNRQQLHVGHISQIEAIGQSLAGIAPTATPAMVVPLVLLTSGASAWMTSYHDRMPVLLRAEDFDAWLNGSLGADALRPAAESALREWPVSRRVNRAGVGEDDPTIVEKVAAA